MTRTSKIEPQDAATHPDDGLYDMLIGIAWEPALRFALELEGALKRCRSRGCRKARGCRLKWEEGEPLDCGGGASEETARMAGALVHFGSIMVMRYLKDVVVPERSELIRRLGGDDAWLGDARGRAIH